MAEIDKIVVFLSGLSFHIFLVAITSKHGVSLLAANSTFETNIMIGMQVLALALLLVSWVIVQALPKVAFIVLANLAFSLSAGCLFKCYFPQLINNSSSNLNFHYYSIKLNLHKNLALLLRSYAFSTSSVSHKLIKLNDYPFYSVLVIFLLVGFRVAYTVQSTHNDSLIIAFYVISAILSLLAAFWNFFSKI